MPPNVFNATTPVEVQLDDFSCAVGAAYWCLRSVGFDITQANLQQVMVPEIVSPEDGLRLGSGAGLAAFLRDRFGLQATNASPVSFEAVLARAGRQPVALGGHRWDVDAQGRVTGHWVGVRGADGGVLQLANPGGTGPRFGQQVLDAAAFAQRGPFAAVFIDAAAPAPAGRQFTVANTGGAGARLREQPSTSAAIKTLLAEGTAVSGDEHAWRLVTTADGQQGWVAEDLLQAN